VLNIRSPFGSGVPPICAYQWSTHLRVDQSSGSAGGRKAEFFSHIGGHMCQSMLAIRNKHLWGKQAWSFVEGRCGFTSPPFSYIIRRSSVLIFIAH
jgi:hypothetical protein